MSNDNDNDNDNDNEYATMQEIIDIINQYANAYIFGLQEADIDDIKQEIAIRFTKGQWHKKAIKQYIYKQIITQTERLKKRNKKEIAIDIDAISDVMTDDMQVSVTDTVEDAENLNALLSKAAKDDRDRRILAMLYQGDSKGSIATALGINPKTVWLRIRAMKERIGTDRGLRA